MPNGPPGEGEIVRQIAQDFLRRGSVGASQNPVDTDVAGRRQRLARPVRRHADDFHVGHCSGHLDPPIKFPQDLCRSPHVLEADVAHPKVGHQLQGFETVLDCLIAAREHEDEIHRGLRGRD